jgi:hypothetical protein
MLSLRDAHLLLPGIFFEDDNLVSSGISLLRTYGTPPLSSSFTNTPARTGRLEFSALVYTQSMKWIEIFNPHSCQ